MSTTHLTRVLVLASLAAVPASALAQPIAGPELEPAKDLADPIPEPAPAHAPSQVAVVPFAAPVATVQPQAPVPPADPGPGVSAGRVGGEVLGAGVGTLLAVGVGLMAMSSERCDLEEESDFCGLGSLVIGTAASFVLTMPLGVYLAGHAGGGNGGFGWTLLGGAAGSLVGIGFAVGMTDAGAGDHVWVALALPIAGAILGYELSSDDNWDDDRVAEPRASVQVMPSLGLTPDGEGVSFGLTGVM